jgi:hypothetical protein
MKQLIWIVFLGGAAAVLLLGGPAIRLAYFLAVLIAITVFRRPVVLGLTWLASRLGLMRGTIERMPATIHLTRVTDPADAARPILAALADAKFVDAGFWSIVELPKIHVDLMVQPEDGMLAAVESASPIGAQVNLHTLYPGGQVVTFTNSELPPPRVMRSSVVRTQLPRSTPAALISQARTQRPKARFLPVSVQEASGVYERLYADEIAFRKEQRG